MNNNPQPKTSYQDFLKDIYNAMKKINQNTTEINDKLDAINKRLSNIEASQLYLGEQIQSKAQSVSSGVSDSHLLELMTKLDGPAELPDVYKLATDMTMLSPQNDVYNLSPPVTSPDNNCELESYSASPTLSNIYESPTSSGFLILE
jgi:hypothetical protein